MVLIRNNACIEVCSETNEWIDCIFLVSESDTIPAVKVLEKAYEDFWEQESDTAYGDFLISRMQEAGIEFEIFYHGEVPQDV